MKEVTYGLFQLQHYVRTKPLHPAQILPKGNWVLKPCVPIKTLALESSLDANPNGEWVIEFSSCKNGHDPHWRPCLDPPWKLDLDVGIQVLCALVKTDTLVIFNENDVPRDRSIVASESYDSKHGYTYTLKFDLGTHYRLRNIKTKELIHGDVL